MYLSRQTGEKVWDVETWSTPDGGETWTSEPVTAGSGTKNVRPVSPRGMLPFSGDMSVLWMRGSYPYYLTYQTSIATILRTGGDEPPVADAAPVPRTGLAPLPVAFDGRASRDPEGPIAEHRWDFGDGATAAGAQAEHVYTRPGRYFPKLTVTDTAGRSDTYVTEIVVDAGVATGPALGLAGGSATLTGTVTPREAASAHFEYGTDDFALRTPDVAAAGDLEAVIGGLTPGATYRYRLVVTTANGTVAGAERAFTADAPPSYRDAVRSTPGLLGYWRLGDAGTTVAADELGARPGAFSATGVTLGQAGALARRSGHRRAVRRRRGRDDRDHAAAHHLRDARGLVPVAGRRRRPARQHVDGRHGLDPRLRDRRADRLPRRRERAGVDDPGERGPRRPLASLRADAGRRRRAALPRRPKAHAPATAPGTATAAAPWHVMHNGNRGPVHPRSRRRDRDLRPPADGRRHPPARRAGTAAQMSWRFTENVEAYSRAVWALLAGDPVAHTVALSVIERVRAGHRWSEHGRMLFGWFDDGEVRGAVSLTPPYELLLSVVPAETTADLVDALGRERVSVPGVNGDLETVDRLVTGWTSTRGSSAVPVRGMRLYRLGTLRPPVPARPRAAGPRRRTRDHRALAARVRRPKPMSRLPTSSPRCDRASTPTASGFGRRKRCPSSRSRVGRRPSRVSHASPPSTPFPPIVVAATAQR